MHIKPSEILTLLDKVDPANNNNTTKNGAAVDMSKFHDALAIVGLGAVDATTDFKLQESADGSASWTDIAGKAITQFAATDDNKLAFVQVKDQEMSKRYLRGVLTTGNGTTNINYFVVLGVMPRFGPASDNKIAALAQTI